jgi:hypothetical protein
MKVGIGREYLEDTGFHRTEDVVNNYDDGISRIALFLHVWK